ncbi:MAG: HAMP domain-containing protein [bacterium]|nr:HAMP domain-containing protein [bacterium]
MSLRQKVALVVSLAVASLFFIDHMLYTMTFEPRFERDTDAMAENEIGHITALIKGEVTVLGARATRLVSVLKDQRLGRVEGLELLTHSGALDVLLVFNESGKVMYHRVVDPINHEPISIAVLPDEVLSHKSVLRCSLRSKKTKNDLERVPEGLIATERGPLLLAARQAKLAGNQLVYVVTGRFLSGRLLKHFQGEGESLEMHLLRGHDQSPRIEDLVDRLAKSPTGHVIERDGDKLMAWDILYDLGGNPACLIGQKMDSTLGSVWGDLSSYSALSLVALVVLCPLVLLLLLQGMVTGPLWKLIEHSKVVARDNTTEERLTMGRNDEIGRLANEFDSMLDQLAVSRSEVIQLARKTGASDIATGVLHNVGNSLNSVGVSARLAKEKLIELPVHDLEVISLVLKSNHDELHNYLTEDERGKTLPAYMEALSNRIQVETEQLGEEISELLNGISGIEHLVTSLQSTGGAGSLIEHFDLAEQVDSIIEINGALVEETNSSCIIRDYDSVGKVDLDRHKLSEVVLHLLRACQRQVTTDWLVEITVGIRWDSDGKISITVADNGGGLDESELARVFAMDSTIGESDPRAGLHQASTSAIEMGAELTAHSEGLGMGTCYRLLLPAVSLST